MTDGFAEWELGDVDEEDARVLSDETKANSDALLASGEDWLVWWRDHGERELRCILMAGWDPIGVNDIPEAWDEYDNYLPGVAVALRDHADEDEAATAIREYLAHVVVDFIGAAGDATQIMTVSDALVAWYEWSYLHGGRKPTEWEDG